MSEIKTNKKVAKIMAGRDYHTGDLKAYDLQNTIIMGKTGSGVDNVVNNIIMHLVEDYSTKEVCIQYFPILEEGNPWLKTTRKLPHFYNQKYGYSTDGVNSLRHCLFECLAGAMEYYEEYVHGMLSERMNVIIVEVNNEICSDTITWNILKALVRYTNTHEYVKTIIVTKYENERLKELEPYIGLRLLTRTSEDISNEFLGCNLSSREEDKYGFVWLTEKDKFNDKKKLSVDFKPDSYLNKICKYLSSGAEVCDDAYSVRLGRFDNVECNKQVQYISLALKAIECFREEYVVNKDYQNIYTEGILEIFSENINRFLDKLEKIQVEEY